jgi:anti-sigma factor RsiW
MKITVNGEPVPVTTGSPGVRWEDTPNRHAYCDGEIRRLRSELNTFTVAGDDLAARYDQLAEDFAVLRERLRSLASRWVEADQRPQRERTVMSAERAECGRQVLAITGEPPP